MNDDLDDEVFADRDYPPSPATRSAPPVEMDEHDDDHGSERDGGHPVHKKIPTWEEAIGVLVDANMAARANSPDRPHRGGGRRGRGGGR
jgi:hypothetical protein